MLAIIYISKKCKNDFSCTEAEMDADANMIRFLESAVLWGKLSIKNPLNTNF